MTLPPTPPDDAPGLDDRRVLKQLSRFENHFLFANDDKKLPLLKRLLRPEIRTRFECIGFDKGPRQDDIIADLIDEIDGAECLRPAQDEIKTRRRKANKLIQVLREKLNVYYSHEDHEDPLKDPVKFTLPLKTYCPTVKPLISLDDFLGRKAPESEATKLLAEYKGVWESYHLTKDAEGEYWSFAKLDLRLHKSDGHRPHLSGEASYFPRWAEVETVEKEDAARRAHSYLYKAWLVGRGELIIEVEGPTGAADMAIAVFRNVGIHLQGNDLFGIQASTGTWQGRPAFSFQILRRPKPPRAFKNGYPITDKVFEENLYEEIKERTRNLHLEALGSGIISDDHIARLERQSPSGSEIWIASHNLQTESLGDDSSEVRQTLVENDAVNIRYRYIYPMGNVNERLEFVKDCISEERLFLYPVEDKVFNQFGLIPTNFLVVNPGHVSPSDPTTRYRAYLQLPGRGTRRRWLRGWLELDTATSRLVRDQMYAIMVAHSGYAGG